MDIQEGLQTLMRLGLTEVQARVYTALATMGVADAKTISTKSLVARPDVYRVMPALSEIGLVETIISTPNRFRATSVNLAISMLLARKKDETEKLRVESRELIKLLENKNVKRILALDASQFVIIVNKKADLKKRIYMTRKSIDNHCLISSQERLETLPHVLIEEITSALLRGVKIRVIIKNPENAQVITKLVNKFKKSGDFKIRYITSSPRVFLFILDMKEALIVDSVKGYFGQFPDLWTSNPSIVGAFQDYFDILWLTSVHSDDPILDNSSKSGLGFNP